MGYYKGKDLQLELSYTQNKFVQLSGQNMFCTFLCMSRSILKVTVDDLQFFQVSKVILVTQLVY